MKIFLVLAYLVELLTARLDALQMTDPNRETLRVGPMRDEHLIGAKISPAECEDRKAIRKSS